MTPEPLPSQNENGILPYWAIVTNEFNDLGLTKAEFRVMSYIACVAGPPRYVCFAKVETIARETRTNPVYVRWIIRHLVHRRLVEKMQRPGKTCELRLADKLKWLAMHGQDADQVHAPYEESKDEAMEKIVWERLWTICPGAPKARYEKLYKEDPNLFEAVLADVEHRVKRAKDPRLAADRLRPVDNVWGLFQFTWDSWKRQNRKRK